MLLFVLLLPSTALAADVVLLPHAGDDALQAERAAAQGAVRSALEGQSMRIVDHAATGDDVLAACETIDCAPALLHNLGADFAVAVAVWRDADSTADAQVYVTFVDGEGHRFPSGADVVDGDVPAAARAALLDARALQLLGPGPWIHVRGLPEGADVILDDTRVGALPYRARIDAGRHRLEIRREGMLPDERTVDVPASATRLVDIDVVLTHAAPVPSTYETSETFPDHPLVGPIVLGAVGVTLGAIVLADVLADDCTRREPTGACTKRESANAPLAIGLGAAGAAAIAGAVVWYFVGGDPDVPESRAGLRLRGTGVTGHF